MHHSLLFSMVDEGEFIHVHYYIVVGATRVHEILICNAESCLQQPHAEGGVQPTHITTFGRQLREDSRLQAEPSISEHLFLQECIGNRIEVFRYLKI